MKTIPILLALCLASGCATGATTYAPASAPAIVPNLRVVDASKAIYRSGQPLPAGFAYLMSIGVSNVVKLNTGTTDDCVAALGMHVTKIPISTWKQIFGPVGRDMTNAVAAIGPGTLVHCTHGQDRTGLVLACYREWSQGWPKAAAQKEMLDDGFHPMLRGLWDFWQALR